MVAHRVVERVQDQSDFTTPALSGGAMYFSATTSKFTTSSIFTVSDTNKQVLANVTPTATANYGMISLGAAPFDGTSTNFFAGNANGTFLAINAAQSFTGDYINCGSANGNTLLNTFQVSSTFPASGNVQGILFNQPVANFPTSNASSVRGIVCNMNPAGSTAAAVVGFSHNMAAGYTGTGYTVGGQFTNRSATTSTAGNAWVSNSGNYGVYGQSLGTGAGTNMGVTGEARGGTSQNMGVKGFAFAAGNNSSNVGVVGNSYNSNAATGCTFIGGYFTSTGTVPTFNTSAALIADDGNAAVPAFIAMHNGSAFFTLTGAPTGTVPNGNFVSLVGTLPAVTTQAQVGMILQVTTAGSSAHQQFGLSCQLLAGYTGAAACTSAVIVNTCASTGTSGYPSSSGGTAGAANFGVNCSVNGSGAGHNVGGYFVATTSTSNNTGLWGVSGGIVAGTNNIGVAGQAHDASASSIGGYFTTNAMTTTPTPWSTNYGLCALMADAGSTSDTAFLCVRGSSTNLFKVLGTGAYFGTVDVVGTVGASASLDVTKGNVKTITSTASTNMTLTPSAAGTAGQILDLIITSDATGGDIITFASPFKPNGTMTLTASKKHTIRFVSDGTNLCESCRVLAL